MEQIPCILACEVGNTAIHLAVVQGDDVKRSETIRIGQLGEMGGVLKDMWSAETSPSRIVAGSVNPSGVKALEAAAEETLSQKVILIGRDIPLPMPTDLPEPESIGTDRLCGAVAAYDRIGRACVVADFGTAITVDCVDDKGVFLGGAILPGLRMSLEALHGNTALLPKVEPGRPDWVFAKNTHQAIVGGVVYGAMGALRELVERYSTELGRWMEVIATGGDAELVCAGGVKSGFVQAIVPDLVLRGVAIAYYKTLLKE